MAKLTPAQTIGPFFHEGLKWAIEAGSGSTTDSATISGRVLDRDGAGISDALIEVWRPGWRSGEEASIPGLQRMATDDSGAFTFTLPQPAQGQVHAHVTVFARGLLRGLFTRVYLPASRDVAAVTLPESVPPARRATLVARPTAPGAYEWNICLSGANETVFFDL
jgi:protocatechuate 3,4-dioxygenase, alpha subunit